MSLRPEAPGLGLTEETPRKGRALPRNPSTGGPPVMATGPGRRSEGWFWRWAQESRRQQAPQPRPC